MHPNDIYILNSVIINIILFLMALALIEGTFRFISSLINNDDSKWIIYLKIRQYFHNVTKKLAHSNNKFLYFIGAAYFIVLLYIDINVDISK